MFTVNDIPQRYKAQCEDSNQLVQHIQNHEYERTKKFLSKNPELVNISNDDGVFPIHAAIKSENSNALFDICNITNADLNIACHKTGNTPIIMAAYQKNFKIFERLLLDARINHFSFEAENFNAENVLIACMKSNFHIGFTFALPLAPSMLLKKVDCFNNSVITKLIYFGLISWVNDALRCYEITPDDIEESLSNENSFNPQSCLINLQELSSRYIKDITCKAN